jgi:hypothetical protein
MTRDPQKRAAVAAIRNEFESSRGPRIWTDYVNALRLVSQVVFTRSSGFVLEFIQNAEDAGQGLSGKGKISISVNQQWLKFVHNGRAFDDANLGAICGIRSSKKPERGTLGYLGSSPFSKSPIVLRFTRTATVSSSTATILNGQAMPPILPGTSSPYGSTSLPNI